MSRGLFAGLAVALLVGAAAAWLATSTEPEEPEQRPALPSTGISKAGIVLRQRGRKQAEIAAERVEVSADGRTTIFSGQPRAVVFEEGTPRLTVTGTRIVYDRATQDVRVEGGLRVTTSYGETLTAPSASWDNTKQIMELRGPVEVSAQSPSPTPRQTAPAQGGGTGDGLGRLRADRVRYLAREQVYIASGNVSLTLGDTQVRADAMRYEQAPQIATAEGRVVVTRRQMQLTAPALRFEVRTEIADASGGVVLSQQGTTVRAPRMRFVVQEEVTIATGGVEVVHGDATVTAPSLRHDGRTGDVTAEGGVTLLQPGTKMTGKRLAANLPARRADMREDVTLIRSAAAPAPDGRAAPSPGAPPEETTVTAARIVFRWDVNEGEAMENVVVRQKDKTAWADRATYSEPANQVTLTGRVVLEQLSGDSLVQDGVLRTPRSAEERQALASVTRLTCTRLVMALRERDAVAEGPLRVTQKDRWASGDRGTYTEATRRLVVTGNVRMQEADGQRLSADRVVISLIEETFEAEGNVETQFTIRPSPPRRP